jgi:hypothetical protein
MEKGLACKGHCEADVEELVRLIKRNVSMSPLISRNIKSVRSARLLSSGFLILIGVVFFACNKKMHVPYFTAMGSVFLAYGVIQAVRTWVATRGYKNVE